MGKPILRGMTASILKVNLKEVSLMGLVKLCDMPKACDIVLRPIILLLDLGELWVLVARFYLSPQLHHCFGDKLLKPTRDAKPFTKPHKLWVI